MKRKHAGMRSFVGRLAHEIVFKLEFPETGLRAAGIEAASSSIFR